jgi:Plasmid pRiA4b ORF-3-like protein
MATKAKAPPNSVYQLKITLSGSKPPIWRRVQVDSHIKLSKLHDIFQEVMGWEMATFISLLSIRKVTENLMTMISA